MKSFFKGVWDEFWEYGFEYVWFVASLPLAFLVMWIRSLGKGKEKVEKIK